ncbi:TPA: carboxypeptidase regulatory-like domain-containing protein [Salmonella enterica subsp. salamae serovar 28:r:e,n,z15]|nr:carboxypeptidase regulatory-like domain-containing protein [Salmonella enterica subsp. salamae serovar 28:r:e,n,z15]
MATILTGTLTDRSGTVLTSTTITLTEIDSRNTLITTTDATGYYRLVVPDGTWRVTLRKPSGAPKPAGMLATAPGVSETSLNDLMSDLQPSSLDIQVLGFMRGLVAEAERAAETIKSGSDDIEKNKNDTLEAAKQAQQALKKAQDIAKTPGPKGEPGGDGRSAFDIWAAQQSAGSDTSLEAFMQYMAGKKGDKGDKGNPGQKGDKGDPGTGGGADLTPLKPFLFVRSLGYGENLNDLFGQDSEGIYSADSVLDLNLSHYPPTNSDGQLQVTNGGNTQIFISWTGELFTRSQGEDEWHSAAGGSLSGGSNSGPGDLSGIKTTVPIPATGFNSATQYPLYAHEAGSALPDHPIPGSSGNAAWGVLWVNTRGGYPGQIFMNYDGRMFCRIRANYGWSAWWQMAGTPVSGGVGTERRLSCSQAVTYGKNVAGSTLTPAQPGTWFAKGDATAGENIMYMRVK